MAKDAGKPSGSTILLEEYFSAGSPAFLTELRNISDARKLLPIVEKWKNDPRPFAREMILEYLNGPLNIMGHNLVVKRLFKAAEARKDAKLMGAFFHAFDVLVRRKRVNSWKWDRASRSTYSIEELKTPRNNITVSTKKNPKTDEKIFVPAYAPKNGRLFSYRTRYYLRRRAWRFFRFLGYKNPADFLAGATAGLLRYTDDDLRAGENILDSWCLLNALYRKSPVLEFTPTHVKLAPNRSLNELTPAPKHLKIWQSPEAAPLLWQLVSAGQSRLVRMWAMAMLKSDHQPFLANLTPEQLLPLFDSFDDETQQFAASALESMPTLPSLPLEIWMRLLTVQNPGALATIAELMLKHVAATRLDLRQTIMLTLSRSAPVANLGLSFLKTRAITTAAERSDISDLSRAQCEALAPKITAYALSILGPREVYDLTLISRFFDSLQKPTRLATWDWLLTDAGLTAFNDPALWSRLLETPYEDIRLRLVKSLEARAGAVATINPDQLAPIWTAVLLGIHRGGRHKIIALHQISRAVVQNAQRGPALIPVLAIALRSVRPAEARVGLAAIVESAEKNPALLDAIAKAIPELRFVSQGATA